MIPLMTVREERSQPYLFKLKLSKNVKRHISRLFHPSGWTDAGQGWEGMEGALALVGGETRRRVVVIRRTLTGVRQGLLDEPERELLGHSV